MTKRLKLIKIGSSVGVVLPEEVLTRLRVELGDELTISEVPNGISLSSDQSPEAQMQAVREVIARRRSALRELAK